MSHPPSRLKAILLAMLVTFLWSTSWVLIKWGQSQVGPLTFAGMRYMLAFLVLLPFLLRRATRTELLSLSRSEWVKLILLGFLYYFITQGAQYFSLTLLPSVTVSLMLNLTSIFVVGLGIVWLNEKPGWIQWVGLILNLLGIYIYFAPVAFERSQLIGLVVIIVGLIANAIGSVMARDINRVGRLSPLVVTAPSMGIGAALMLFVGVLTEPAPALQVSGWLMIIWMAVVNTAIAFTIWMYTMKSLTAMESTIINSTMLFQVAILAWVFLGEGLTSKQIIGIVVGGIGAVLVQVHLKANKKKSAGGIPAQTEVS